jgi:flavin reductase (DIM6/NTAB) family NADH-FMN oxidoreductase RutF
MHRTIDPTILYFGTPVALISSLNQDGSPNIAPMSSAWWLGWSCMLGLGAMGQTSDNSSAGSKTRFSCRSTHCFDPVPEAAKFPNHSISAPAS